MTYEILTPGIELLESMRSVGYSFDDAVADLIDNSITADASTVEVEGDVIGGRYVTILDNGNGMSPEEARTALRLAGTGRDSRKDNDLGRFGLGLKTASLSQGRKLTLASKMDGEVTVIQWDLDYVEMAGDWRIRVLNRQDIEHIPAASAFDRLDSGTLVIWESLDYLIGDSDEPDEVMAKHLAQLREHLGLVFHQFLDGNYLGGLKILVNSVEVKPLDPFLSGIRKTQRSPIEHFKILGETVEMQSFVLPHSSALTEKELRRKDLSHAMESKQGFYVYRGHRLIDWGNWYGVTKQSQLKKQTRVRVEFPNSLDHLWQLDIRKSKVQPPREFLNHYRALILNETKKSERVHTFRGRVRGRSDEITPLWNFIEDRLQIRYEINQAHPLVQSAFEGLSKDQRRAVATLLDDVARCIPAQNAYVEISDNKTFVAEEYNEDDIRKRVKVFLDGGLIPRDSKVAFDVLSGVEPFSGHPKLAEIIDDLIGVQNG
ncbi:ATP-binding protein [Bacillus subtilis]|nr:ATP-binding protein [Bacillus subtilis]